MNIPAASLPTNAIALLRRVAQTRPAGERCDLCAISIASAHRHLWETAARKIVCACDACAMRFQAVADGRFKLIPRDVRRISNFQMTDAQWESLALPIQLTFFRRDSQTGKVVAMYPSPAGATESLLPAAQWEELEASNPALARMEADVEALLVNRVDDNRDYFIAPIDVCFELTGVLRLNWRGLLGGEEVWEKIGAFFSTLRERAIPTGEFTEAARA